MNNKQVTRYSSESFRFQIEDESNISKQLSELGWQCIQWNCIMETILGKISRSTGLYFVALCCF